MLFRSVVAALFCGCAAVPSALALPFVSVSAGSAETAAGGNSSTVDLDGSSRVWGRAFASDTDFLYFGTGPRNCTSDPISCAASGPAPSGRASGLAEANGENGTLKASAVAFSTAGANARALLIDTITLTDDIIEIDLDINKLGGNAGGNWEGDLRVRVYIPGTDIESDPDLDLFVLDATRNAQQSYVYYGQLDPNLLAGDQFILTEQFSIPSAISFDLDLGLYSWGDGEPLPLGVGMPAIGSTITLAFELFADADCFETDCEVFAIADNTLHLGIEGVSENGYSYPGLAVDGGGGGGGDGGGDGDGDGGGNGGEVPEPASLPLLLISSLAAAALLRTSQRRASR